MGNAMRASFGLFIESLREGNETDALALKPLNIIQAIHYKASKAVKLPTKYAVKFLSCASAKRQSSPDRRVLAVLYSDTYESSH